MYISVKTNPYSQLVVQWPFKWPAMCNSVKTNPCLQPVVQWPFKWPAKCNSVKTNPCSQLVVQWPFKWPAKCNSVKTNPCSQLVVQWPFKWPVKCNSVKTNPYSQPFVQFHSNVLQCALELRRTPFHNLFTCRISMHGGCHILPWLSQFMGVLVFSKHCKLTPVQATNFRSLNLRGYQRELISASQTSYEHNNTDLNRLRYLSPGNSSKYKKHNLHRWCIFQSLNLIPTQGSQSHTSPRLTISYQPKAQNLIPTQDSELIPTQGSESHTNPRLRMSNQPKTQNFIPTQDSELIPTQSSESHTSPRLRMSNQPKTQNFISIQDSESQTNPRLRISYQPKTQNLSRPTRMDCRRLLLRVTLAALCLSDLRGPKLYFLVLVFPSR